MRKPRPYLLKDRNFDRNKLIAEIEIDDGAPFIAIDTDYGIELKPRNARALAKRLNAMADYVEQEQK